MHTNIYVYTIFSVPLSFEEDRGINFMALKRNQNWIYQVTNQTNEVSIEQKVELSGQTLKLQNQRLGHLEECHASNFHPNAWVVRYII